MPLRDVAAGRLRRRRRPLRRRSSASPPRSGRDRSSSQPASTSTCTAGRSAAPRAGARRAWPRLAHRRRRRQATRAWRLALALPPRSGSRCSCAAAVARRACGSTTRRTSGSCSAPAALNAVLAYATGEAARRRGDARRVPGLARLPRRPPASSGCTRWPRRGSCSTRRTPGFALATPVGLLVASGFAAASAPSDGLERARCAIVRPRAAAARAAARPDGACGRCSRSLQLPPLDDRDAPERATGPLVAVADRRRSRSTRFAVVRYLGLWRGGARRCCSAMAAAFALLAEAMIASRSRATGTRAGGSGTC